MVSSVTTFEIERRRFESAQSAFANLNADSVPFARLAIKKLKYLGTALSHGSFVYPRLLYRPRYGKDLHAHMSEVLHNYQGVRLSNKTWKCVKLLGSTDVAFYSDSYRMDPDSAVALASICRSNGLYVRIFEWDDPPLDFNEGYIPPATAKVIGGGYRHLYRGKLVGFVVGAYGRCKWRKVREAMKARAVCLFWMEAAAKTHGDPHGPGHARDRAAFEAMGL